MFVWTRMINRPDQLKVYDHNISVIVISKL